MVMIRPRGKASRIYREIFSLDEVKVKKSKRDGYNSLREDKKNNELISRDYALNPRARNP